MPIHKSDQKNRLFSQLSSIPIEHPEILDVMKNNVPRELFMPKDMQSRAYDNDAITIEGYPGFASLSQPAVIVIMLDLLNIHKSDVVAEIGTATGYQAAVLSFLAREIHTIEVLPDLAQKAQKNLHALGCTNVTVHVGDGAKAFLPDSSVDRMIITAAIHPDKKLPSFAMVKNEGIIVAPIGGVDGQKTRCRLVKWKKNGDVLEEMWSQDGYSFVPLVGEHGWEE